jgi:hypothetical protein
VAQALKTPRLKKVKNTREVDRVQDGAELRDPDFSDIESSLT